FLHRRDLRLRGGENLPLLIRRRHQASLLRSRSIVRARNPAESSTRCVATGGESALERLKLRRGVACCRRATIAQVSRHLLDLHLRRLHVEQECFARFVLQRGDVEPRVAAHLEGAGRRVAVAVECDLVCAWRHVWTAHADVVRRNRELHRCIGATATATTRAPSATASSATTATRGAVRRSSATTAAAPFFPTKVARARGSRRWHVAKIPDRALHHARLVRPIEFANDFTICAAHGELHLLRRL